jgi:hypothetical protein
MHVYPCANIKRDFLFWLPSHVQLSGDCCVTIPSELKSAEQVGVKGTVLLLGFWGKFERSNSAHAAVSCQELQLCNFEFLFSCNVTYGSLYSLPVSCLYVDTIKWAKPPNGQKGAGRRRKRHCSQNEATISKLWHCRWAVDTQAAFEHNSRKAHLRLLVNCQ